MPAPCQVVVEAQEATVQWGADQAETLPPVALLHPEAVVCHLVECLMVEISQEAQQA